MVYYFRVQIARISALNIFSATNSFHKFGFISLYFIGQKGSHEYSKLFIKL